ncbi:unnamed protein product [Dicrocoelium dendriticum]|nr:unnamed protein product [Dicrocoelium dendriticum]
MLQRPTLLPSSMRMVSRLTDAPIISTELSSEDTKPRPFDTFGDEEVVVVEPTDPDEDRLLQEELNRVADLTPFSTSLLINRSHPLSSLPPTSSNPEVGRCTNHPVEAIPVAQLVESPKTVDTVSVTDALQSLLSASARVNQFHNTSIQPLLTAKVNTSANLVSQCATPTPLSTLWLPPSGTTTTMAPTSSSTNSLTSSFEDITKLAQHMAPLNPLTAAVLVNCATVNLIGQLAGSLVAPVYNTGAFTSSTGLFQNGGITLSGLLPTLLSNFNANVSLSEAYGSNIVRTTSDANPPEQHVVTQPSSDSTVSPHTCPATAASSTTLTTSMTETMNRTAIRVKRFKCSAPNCNLAFYSRFNLAEHVRTHTGERPFTCPDADCSAAFKRRRDLRDHWNAHLSRMSSATMTADAGSKTDAMSESEVTVNRNEFPDRSTASVPVHTSIPSSPLDVNDTTIKMTSETEVPDGDSDANYFQADDQSTIGRYRCPFHGCDKSYARRHRLNQHVSWHTGAKPFQCDEPNCKIRYYSEGDLRKHKLAHLNASDRSHRRRHACPYPNCGKAYSKMNKLKEHVRSHTGERPYVCREPGCGAAFIRLYGVRRHELTHVFGRRRAKRLARFPTAEPSTANVLLVEPPPSHVQPPRIEQPAPSAITDAVSSILASLGLRPSGANEVTPDITASSSPRALPAIAPKTTTPVSLRPLSPISGPPGMRRPHVCPFKDCGKAFPKLNKLREHVCRHTGERPYVCDKCTASFVRMYDLRRHGNIHLRGGEPRSAHRVLAPRPHEFQNEAASIPHTPMQPEAETVPVN